MKRIICLLLALVMTLSVCAGLGEGAANASETTADSIVIGKIYTADSSDSIVEAVAVKDGIIIYSGDEAGARALAGEKTEITEIEDGKLVIPGFADTHTHVTSMQLLNKMVVFQTTDTLEDYITKLTAYMEEHQGMPIIMGKGWINSSFENGCPTADILDAVSPDLPVCILSSDNHSLWCNTAMMELMGVTKDTETPAGGTIERYEDGRPNGCFRETAMPMIAGPILAFLALSPEVNASNIVNAQKQYATLGYTSYLDATINNMDIPEITTAVEVYEEMDKNNELILYTQGAFVINNSDNALELLDTAIAYKESTAGGMFAVTGIKIFMDGVIEGSTAYLSEPYANREEPYYGEGRWTTKEDLEKLTEIIVRANQAGLSVKFHSMGDQASHDALDCIEKAYEQIGDAVLEARNSLTHLQVIQQEDIERMARLNVCAVLNDWANKQPGFYEETEVKYLGEERAEHEYLYKSFLNAGVHCSAATDFGGSFLVDSIWALNVYVNRTPQNGDMSRQLNPSECLTMQEALKVMSTGGAYEMASEDRFGTLTVGMEADLLVLDRDLLSGEGVQVLGTKILKTMSDGRWVYDAAAAE